MIPVYFFVPHFNKIVRNTFFVEKEKNKPKMIKKNFLNINNDLLAQSFKLGELEDHELAKFSPTFLFRL